MFVDRVQIEVQAGSGGNGCVSFRRERYLPKGGPDGGNGGHGGSVYIVAKPGINNLAGLGKRRMWKAESGRHGEGSNRHGRKGESLTLEVPPGTIVRDLDENFVIKDLALSGDSVEVARGGRGGYGNTHFKSSVNRAPRQSTQGDQGERRRVVLELKLIADVGLVGKPNAGKSTLLSRLTHARPEIAAYPFTTKTPHLGMVQVNLDQTFVIADIPGLIEGAHQGAGLGHEFLRHVERTRVLVHLVEPMPMDGSDPLDNYRSIRHELEQHDSDLAKRAEIVAVTKAVLPGTAEVNQRLCDELDTPVLLISSVTGQNLNRLTQGICEKLAEVEAESTP